ncbi:MAG TPA: DUF151 domain-containing protein, partial [Rhodothermales bacterium]|nr:DUF151 domain-containing protein [Rhodothermales bacterium]
AQAIALELEKIDPPRPMTHDLLRDVFRSVRANVSEIVIDELREGTFYAKIRYEFEGEEQELDARPSDAVALAVRVDVPIYVEVKVLEEAGIPTEEDGESPSVPVRSSEPKPKEKPASPKSNIERMQAELQKAIEDEEYEKAARLRDEIERLTGKSN